MLKAKQAYQYDTRNWNFDICKKYQTVRWKHEDNVMSSRVKEKNRLAEFNYKWRQLNNLGKLETNNEEKTLISWTYLL